VGEAPVSFAGGAGGARSPQGSLRGSRRRLPGLSQAAVTKAVGPLLEAALASYTRREAGVRERTDFYARRSVLKDLRYGVESQRAVGRAAKPFLAMGSAATTSAPSSFRRRSSRRTSANLSRSLMSHSGGSATRMLAAAVVIALAHCVEDSAFHRPSVDDAPLPDDSPPHSSHIWPSIGWPWSWLARAATNPSRLVTRAGPSSTSPLFTSRVSGRATRAIGCANARAARPRREPWSVRCIDVAG
jgi:hypothetical protein